MFITHFCTTNVHRVRMISSYRSSWSIFAVSYFIFSFRKVCIARYPLQIILSYCDFPPRDNFQHFGVLGPLNCWDSDQTRHSVQFWYFPRTIQPVSHQVTTIWNYNPGRSSQIQSSRKIEFRFTCPETLPVSALKILSSCVYGCFIQTLLFLTILK